MPYCDHCAKYWTPNSMNDDGSCPRCGADLEPPPNAEADVLDEAEREKVPWHFKLMIVALVVYLGYRFVELGAKIFT
jgi:hypothetical protein